MQRGNYTVVVLGALAAIVLVFGGWTLVRQQSGSDDSLLGAFHVPTLSFGTHGTSTEADTTSETKNKNTLTTTEGVERWYTNTTLKFSFRLPDGFSAPEIDTGVKGVHGVLVYNDAKARLTVFVRPIAEGSAISADSVRANLPGVTIYDVKEKTIGTLVRGIYFRNNSSDWNGDGVGFWAAYNGYVYQLMAARKDQELLDFVIANWFFAPPTPSRP